MTDFIQFTELPKLRQRIEELEAERDNARVECIRAMDDYMESYTKLDVKFQALTAERDKLQGQTDNLVMAVQAAVSELEAQINYRAPMTARCVERVVAHLNAALEPS